MLALRVLQVVVVLLGARLLLKPGLGLRLVVNHRQLIVAMLLHHQTVKQQPLSNSLVLRIRPVLVQAAQLLYQLQLNLVPSQSLQNNVGPHHKLLRARLQIPVIVAIVKICNVPLVSRSNFRMRNPMSKSQFGLRLLRLSQLPALTLHSALLILRFQFSFSLARLVSFPALPSSLPLPPKLRNPSQLS